MTDRIDQALADLDAQLGIEPDEPAPEAPDTGGTSSQQEPKPQSRDDRGRFASSDGTPEQPDPAAETPAGEPEGELILGRFKSHEELAKAYEHLDREYGRRGQEYGELKKELAEMRAALEREPSQPITGDLIARDPQRATQLAYTQEDAEGLAAAFQAWKEEDPAAAGAWAAAVHSQQQLAELNDEWEERYASLERMVAPLSQTAQRGEITDAWKDVKERIPDLADHAEEILRAAQSQPALIMAIYQGEREEKVQAIESLYKIAAYDKLQAGRALADAAGRARADEEAQARQDKHQAFVAAGSQRNEPETISDDERWLQEVFDPAAERYMARD